MSVGEDGSIRLPLLIGELDVSSRKNPAPATLEPGPPSSGTRRRILRWSLNAWLVFHVAAIIIAPASVSPSSELMQSLWRVFQPYLQVMYLNNGYHFFAPDPSESTLLSFAAERDDGTVIRGTIPHRGIVPRLLYHRHFMLTEQMNSGPEELEQPWYRSYAEHIGQKYGAKQVSLTRKIHYLPTMDMVRSGIRLDNPDSYKEQELGTFPCGKP
jgi:hypothetical protein